MMNFRQTLFLLALGALLLPGIAPGADTSPIPTRQFVNHAQVRKVAISPDGQHIALTYEQGSQVGLGIMNLASRQITAQFEFGENEHVLNFWWSSNKRVVMAVGKVTGNLDNMGRPQRLYAADLDGRRRLEITPDGMYFEVLHPLPDNNRHILISRYHPDDDGEPRPNLLNTYDGKIRAASDLPSSNHRVSALVADQDGELRGAAAMSVGKRLDEREISIYLRHERSWRQINVQARRSPVNLFFLGFSHDNQQVYLASNHDLEENDRLGVFRYDFRTEQITLLHRHETLDTGGLIHGPKGEVLGAWTSAGPMEYHFFEEEAEWQPQAFSNLVRLIRSFPQDDVRIVSTDKDGRRSIVAVSGDRNPGSFYLLDTEAMELSFIASTLPELPLDSLVPMEPVVIEARDGLHLHGFLTRPAGQKEKLPLVLNVHGGPFGVTDTWGYHPEAQLMAQHGYATLQVNYRGSGGRGEDFMQAGWREWGGKMQDDLTDATRWAIDQGIADPDRICIYGGSYGGYATLMGLIREPELYRCGIGYVGVYDLPWFRSGDDGDVSRQTRYGRDGRANFERFMSTAVGDDADRLRATSPVHNAERIQAPLYLVHGGSDVRVVIGHFNRLREALDALGKDYRWMVKEEEGHGFYNVDNRVELYDSMLEFLDQHIGPDREATD